MEQAALAYTNSYLESETLSSDPLKLVNLLYRGAIEAVAGARRHLAAGEIRERSRKVMKAWGIVNELRRSLDDERGGGIGPCLRELYVYIQSRLLEANAQQQDAPLAEVEQLLTTLQEGWRSAQAGCPAAPSIEPYQPVNCTY